MRLLVLKLDAPLQSWGLHGHWQEKDAGREPTKSGVVGLIACAMGIKRQDIPSLSQKIRIGVRVENEVGNEGKLLRDYKTIDIGKKDKIVSNLWYQQGSSYTVFVDAGDLTDNIALALTKPKWIIYLGRKSCPITNPPLAEIIETNNLMESIREYPLRNPGRKRQRRYVVDDENGKTVIMDEPLYNNARMYAPRTVTCGIVEVKPTMDNQNLENERASDKRGIDEIIPKIRIGETNTEVYNEIKLVNGAMEE